jgi:hypothetical protein
MRFAWTAALCLAVASAACGGGAEPKSVPPASGEAPAGDAVVAASNPTAAAFGVAECDDYIAKYTECVSSKVPTAVRSAMTAAIDQTKAQWKAAAMTPEGRAGLAEGCIRAHEAAKAAMQSYGCSW